MKRIIALVLLTQIGACFAANTIIAIVDKELITLQSIEEKISLTSSFDEKMSVLNNQINTLIQIKKASELKLILSQKDINKAISTVAKYNNIDTDELKKYPEFSLLEKKIIINLTLLKLQQFITKDADIKISEKEITDNCKSNSNIKKQIKIAQIIISKVKDSNELNVSTELQIKKFLKKLSSHISKGASFEAFAKLHSQHPSYVNGGLSDWLFIDNPILEMFDKLEDKEVSIIYPIKENWGIAIKVDERFLDLNLNKCKDDLKNIKKQNFYLSWLKKLRNSSNIEIFSHKL